VNTFVSIYTATAILTKPAVAGTSDRKSIYRCQIWLKSRVIPRQSPSVPAVGGLGSKLAYLYVIRSVREYLKKRMPSKTSKHPKQCFVKPTLQIQLDPANLIRTRSFRIPRYFELKTIFLGFALQSFTIGYFELSLFRTIFRFPWELENAGFNCISKRSGLDKFDLRETIAYFLFQVSLYPEISTQQNGHRSISFCFIFCHILTEVIQRLSKFLN